MTESAGGEMEVILALSLRALVDWDSPGEEGEQLEWMVGLQLEVVPLH
jgi:hypothetical protein